MIGRDEVARRLFVHPNTVTKWSDRGWLPCHRIPTRRWPGGVRMYDPADVKMVADKLLRGETMPRQRRSDAGVPKKLNTPH